MCVAEGVHLQSANVARQQDEVLGGRGDHVPGLKVEERHHKVQADCRGGTNHQVCENIVSQLHRHLCLLIVVCICQLVPVSKLTRYDVNDGEGCVGHDDGIQNHRRKVQPLGPLRAVAKGEDELHADQQHTDIAQDGEYVLADVVTEGVDGWVGYATRNEVESQVEVCQREVSEEKLQELIDEFDMQKYLARHGVVGRPNLPEVNERVDGRKEGPVEPATALGDEFRDGV